MAARTLHISSPLMHGPDIRALQVNLLALGYRPGLADGQYGPSTEAAVRAFQVDHGLRVDGWDGPATSTAIVGALTKPHPAPPRPVGKTPGLLSLAEAVKHLGVKESPAGSNLQPFGAWIGINGVPWCNIFVSYCFEIAAAVQLCKGFAGPGAVSKGCTYVPTTEAWLRATGQWLGRVEPQPGDIAIYNWDGGVPDHIGIVEAPTGSDSFTAIEGNTSIGNDSDGGEVMRRDRTLANVDGFGRIR